MTSLLKASLGFGWALTQVFFQGKTQSERSSFVKKLYSFQGAMRAIGLLWSDFLKRLGSGGAILWPFFILVASIGALIELPQPAGACTSIGVLLGGFVFTPLWVMHQHMRLTRSRVKPKKITDTVKHYLQRAV